MLSRTRKSKANLSVLSLPAALAVGLLFSGARAQWAWAKDVGISGTTVWGAAAQDKDGAFYFGGVSDKLTGTPVRGFVMAKYGDTVAAWNTRLLGGTAAYAGETCVGVDGDGNSYMLDKFRDTPLKLPDSTEISYFLPCYFVSKFAPNGKMAWCKKLVVGGIFRFNVMSDGTVGILATNITKPFIYGSDTIPLSANGVGPNFIEIKADGTLGRLVAVGDVTELGITYAEWKEPGKVFVVAAEAKALDNTLYHRGLIDLESKKLTDDGTPLDVKSPPNTFRWENNGFPNSPTTVLEPKSGHVFALMSAINGDSRLNDADSIYRQTNTQVRDGYLVELDDQMKVVRKIHLTNPVQVAVRDSQVVVVGIVRGTGDFGFVTPDTTIKITLKQYLQDGYVAYVMDRDFKYKKHALVEGTYQTTLTPNTTLIGPDGGVYLSMQAGGDLTLQGRPVYNRGRYLGTVLARVAGQGQGQTSLEKHARPAGERVYLSPLGNELSIDRAGAYRYQLTDVKGVRLAAGAGKGHTVVNVARIPEGIYFLATQGEGAESSRLIHKSNP